MNNLSNPLISIIVPCYKQAQYLSECLQSVLDQTYQNWECIIVNDGSPDDTENIAKAWCIKDKRIKYLYKDNSGVSAARNAGITIAKGQWILPLDADDKIAPQYLELAVQVIEKDDNIGIIYCEAEFFGDKTGKWELGSFSFESLLKENMIFCTAFFKKEDWAKIGGYDCNMIHGFEDWEFWINLMINIRKDVLKLNYNGFYYRKTKTTSRDDLINSNIHLKRQMEIMIYNKHLDTYLAYYGTMQDILRKQDAINGENNFLKNENAVLYKELKCIRKTIVYKVLYYFKRLFHVINNHINI